MPIISEVREDGDIISDMEQELDKLIQEPSPITRKEYVQFWTAHIIEDVPLSIPKIAKVAELSEDRTAEILMTLQKLEEKYPDVQKEIRNKKLKRRPTDKTKVPRRKFKKQQ